MENASKALIIATEILVGVLLLTLLAVAFAAAGNFSKTVNDNIDAKTVAEFNAQFLAFEGRKDLTAQDVITMGNLAKNYNQSEEGEIASYKIKVIVRGVTSRYTNAHLIESDTSYDFIKEYSVDTQASFTWTKVTYQKTTGKVNQIEIKLNT